VKPFDLRELEARIRVHLKPKKQTIIEINDVKVDLENREFIK